MVSVVLGGTGFVGTHLVGLLAKQALGVRAVGLKPNPYRGEISGCEYIYGDWNDGGVLARALDGEIGCVYHLVGTVDVEATNRNPADDVRQTVLGSLRLLDVCIAQRVRRVVFVSSGGSVYGIPRAIPISEDHPTEPISAHGISKLAVEKYLQLFHRLHGLEYRIARCSNPYGEWQNPFRRQGAVAVFLFKAVSGKPITVWGDGTVVRDYVYVGDVIEALVGLGEDQGPGGVFNVGGGRGVSIQELLEAVAQVTGRTPQVEFRSERPYDVPVNVLDISAIVARLGWRPKVGLLEGLYRTLKWILQLRESSEPRE